MVVRDGHSLLVRRGAVGVRVRPIEQEAVARREVAVARALRECGVPHAPLVDVDGSDQPLVVGSTVVTGWRWVDAVGPASASDLGALARRLHDGTVGVPPGSVPPVDPLGAALDAVSALPSDDEQASVVRQRAEELTEPWRALVAAERGATVIVHGDLHRDNVVCTDGGPLLTDLELSGVGPAAYDVAPAVVAVERYGADPAELDDFLRAYGADPRDDGGFATCTAAYELWVTAWAVSVAHRRDDWAVEAAVRVATLRDGTSARWHLS